MIVVTHHDREATSSVPEPGQAGLRMRRRVVTISSWVSRSWDAMLSWRCWGGC